MPLRLGLLAYPLFILVLVFGKSAGTVSKFMKAGAVSLATARKPASVQVKDVELVKRAAKRGALIATDDGRYYVNTERLQRVRRRWTYAISGVTVVFTALAILAWHPWASS